MEQHSRERIYLSTIGLLDIIFLQWVKALNNTINSGPPSLASMDTPRSSYSSVSTGTINCVSWQTESCRKRHYFGPRIDIQIRLCVLWNQGRWQRLCGKWNRWGRPKARQAPIWQVIWSYGPFVRNFGVWTNLVNFPFLTSTYVSIVFLCRSVAGSGGVLWVSRHWLLHSWCLYLIYIVGLVQPDVTTHFHWLFCFSALFNFIVNWQTSCSHVSYPLNLAYPYTTFLLSVVAQSSCLLSS